MSSDACASYNIGPTKDGRTIKITAHCHASLDWARDHEEHWYEVVVPMPDGSVTRVCSEYWWPDRDHAMAAAMGRYISIEKPSEEKWDDKLIVGAVRRIRTA